MSIEIDLLRKQMETVQKQRDSLHSRAVRLQAELERTKQGLELRIQEMKVFQAHLKDEQARNATLATGLQKADTYANTLAAQLSQKEEWIKDALEALREVHLPDERKALLQHLDTVRTLLEGKDL